METEYLMDEVYGERLLISTSADKSDLMSISWLSELLNCQSI